jgi:hypothetical protein
MSNQHEPLGVLFPSVEELLLALKKPHGGYGSSLLQSAEKFREGAHIEEISLSFFELRSDFGVTWALNSDLFAKACDHNIVSRGHFRDATSLLAWT